MIMGGRLLGNVKDFEMSKNDKWMSFLLHPSRLSVSFTGFEELYKLSKTDSNGNYYYS